MKNENAVEATSVTKKFDIKYTTKYGGTAKSGIKQVLDGMNFDVKKGEILGIVGRNGSGKSTLLKVLSGIMYSDSGKLDVCGKVAGILELGMGFQGELSGRENAYLKCGMYGFSEKEIDGFIDDIIAFSELGEQIDHPLRTYSSGMTAKLAFSVLIHIRCDVLIIDEVLSVGDAGFNAKCKLVFDKMKKEKKTIIIASHNISTIEKMCDRVLWIDNGKVREIGDAISVCSRFTANLTDSYETLLPMAESGDVLSQNRLGVMFRDGIAVERNEDEAIKWFSKASSMGFTEAQLNLADIKCSKGDIAGAIDIYRIASDAGDPVAISRLLSLDDNEVKISNEFASEVKKSAEDGNIRSMKLYADMLYNGIAIIKNQTEAYKWFLKCAQLGNVACQLTVAFCNKDGIGIQKNGLEAIKWFTIASNNGNGRARMELADIYRRGASIPIDMQLSVKWYTEAANCGDANAMMQLGLIFRDGIGTEKNESKSRYWLDKFARQGRINAEVIFGDILCQGYFDERKDGCIKWYEDAANGGHVFGLSNLANCYRDGICLTADSSKAYEYYVKAGKMGFSPALLESALMLLKGNGCVRDLKESFKLVEKASNMGNNNATIQLANMYQFGVGTEKDVKKAKKLYDAQKELGNMYAGIMSRCDSTNTASNTY